MDCARFRHRLRLLVGLSRGSRFRHLRDRPQGYVRRVVGVLAAKGLPGALVIASALKLSQTLAVLGASIAIGVWVLGLVLERLGVQVGTRD
jgi:hypothetical protein